MWKCQLFYAHILTFYWVWLSHYIAVYILIYINIADKKIFYITWFEIISDCTFFTCKCLLETETTLQTNGG